MNEYPGHQPWAVQGLSSYGTFPAAAGHRWRKVAFVLSGCAGTGEASAAVQAMRSLPQQQQLVLCVAAKLLGQADQTEAALLEGRAPGTPTAKSKVGRVTQRWKGDWPHFQQMPAETQKRSMASRQPLHFPCRSAMQRRALEASTLHPGRHRESATNLHLQAQKQRAGALLSPSHCRTPSGKGRQPGTPAKAPGSATAAVSRSSLLGASQECSLGLLHESYMQLCKQVRLAVLSTSRMKAGAAKAELHGSLLAQAWNLSCSCGPSTKHPSMQSETCKQLSSLQFEMNWRVNRKT